MWQALTPRMVACSSHGSAQGRVDDREASDATDESPPGASSTQPSTFSAMADIEVSWTVRHRRRLEHGEDPRDPACGDVEHLLWAVESGEVQVRMRILE